MSADDSHATVQNALQELDGTAEGSEGLQLADLNDTERKQAIAALRRLSQLDAALAERSEIVRHELGWDELGQGDGA